MNIEMVKEICKEKTLFRSSQFMPDWFEIFNHAVNDEVRQILKKEHGNDVEIFNDVFAQGELPSIFKDPS